MEPETLTDEQIKKLTPEQRAKWAKATIDYLDATFGEQS